MLLLAVSVAGCATEEIVPEAYVPTNAWDSYRRGLQDAGLAGTALGSDWRQAADTALAAPVEIRLPHVERGTFDPRQANAFGYRFEVARGQRIGVQVTLDGTPVLDVDPIPVDEHRDRVLQFQ